jgi:hypothetical protein
MDEMLKTEQTVKELSDSELGCANSVDLSQSLVLPKSRCIAFDVQYEEVMDLLKEKIREKDLILTLLQDYENHYEVNHTP